MHVYTHEYSLSPQILFVLPTAAGHHTLLVALQEVVSAFIGHNQMWNQHDKMHDQQKV